MRISKCIHCGHEMDYYLAPVYCDECGLPWFGEKSGLHLKDKTCKNIHNDILCSGFCIKCDNYEVADE